MHEAANFSEIIGSTRVRPVRMALKLIGKAYIFVENNTRDKAR